MATVEPTITLADVSGAAGNAVALVSDTAVTSGSTFLDVLGATITVADAQEGDSLEIDAGSGYTGSVTTGNTLSAVLYGSEDLSGVMSSVKFTSLAGGDRTFSADVSHGPFIQYPDTVDLANNSFAPSSGLARVGNVVYSSSLFVPRLISYDNDDYESGFSNVTGGPGDLDFLWYILRNVGANTFLIGQNGSDTEAWMIDTDGGGTAWSNISGIFPASYHLTGGSATVSPDTTTMVLVPTIPINTTPYTLDADGSLSAAANIFTHGVPYQNSNTYVLAIDNAKGYYFRHTNGLAAGSQTNTIKHLTFANTLTQVGNVVAYDTNGETSAYIFSQLALKDSANMWLWNENAKLFYSLESNAWISIEKPNVDMTSMGFDLAEDEYSQFVTDMKYNEDLDSVICMGYIDLGDSESIPVATIYDLATETWSSIPATPTVFKDGGSITSLGTDSMVHTTGDKSVIWLAADQKTVGLYQAYPPVSDSAVVSITNVSPTPGGSDSDWALWKTLAIVFGALAFIGLVVGLLAYGKVIGPK